MRARYVVDTNVLIAASAADPSHPKDIDATPPDFALRRVIWEWLAAFQSGPSRLILDYQQGIANEYKKKLSFNDFGRQVVQYKWDTSAVDLVSVEYDSNGHGILADSLTLIVHDRDDRKMVAAALASHANFGEGCVAFAGDTDWHDWEEHLLRHHVNLEPIIEAWSRHMHAEKNMR